jgi:hypothetical protein
MMPFMATLAAAPGDVLAVWTSSSLTSDLIRVGEALRGLPAVANHVAIITHQDQKGRWIGIQGRPGGVGLVDCTYWLSDSRTRSNHAQPKPNDHNQLTLLLGSCAKSLGIQYDWVGIAEDAGTHRPTGNVAPAASPGGALRGREIHIGHDSTINNVSTVSLS